MAVNKVAAVSLVGWLLAGLTTASAAGPDGPGPAVPADTPGATEAAAPKDEEPIIYIFSGALPNGGETYSGTLVAAAAGPEFELKLGKGATCDNSKLDPDKGLLRLPETACSDGRKLKALFVYQEGGFLRVYGTLGDIKFSTQAHALPSDAPEPVAAKPVSPPADLMDKPR